jgi:outer membrane protein
MSKPGRAILMLCVLSTLGAGCRMFRAEHYMEQISTQRELREIEPLDLDSMCVAPEDEPENPDIPVCPIEPEEGPPPEEVTLTLQECRAVALERNLQLGVELITPAIAAQSVSEEEARFEPLFFGRAGYLDSEQPTSSALDSTQVNQWNGDLGVQFPLRTGGTLTFDVGADRTETNNAFSTLNPAYSSAFNASISQNLLRNAGPRANTYAIQIARYDTQISEARAKLEVIRVLAAVDRVYWRLYAARRLAEVRRNEYELAVALLDQAKRLVDAGAAAEVEVIRAEAGVGERVVEVIRADNGVRDRERELKRVINKAALPVDSPTVVLPATEPNPVRYYLDLPRLVEAALGTRMEMLELELQIARDAATIDFQRNQALPVLALDYTFTVHGLGSSTGDAFDLMFDHDFNTHRAGLQFSVPIGNQQALSRLRGAIFARVQRLATKDLREVEIREQVAASVDQLEATWQAILATRQSVILAARNLDAEQRQFELGLRTSTDVLNAQTSLADAQSQEIAALVEYQVAQIDLAFATGTVLGATRVRWEPIVPPTKG